MKAAVLAAVTLLAACGRFHFEGESGVGEDALIDDSATADAPIDPALLVKCELWMRMDETAWGTVIDACGGDNNGTITGSAMPTVDAQRGSVGLFGGDTSCISVPDAANLRGGAALTMSVWVYATATTPTGYGLISKRHDQATDNAYGSFIWGPNFGADTSTNHAYVDIDGFTDRTEDTMESFLGSWRQVTTVFDGSLPNNQRVSLYVDGAFSMFMGETSSMIPVTATPADVSIGCLPVTGPAQGLVGKLDDAVIWSRALSAADVTGWYDATKR